MTIIKTTGLRGALLFAALLLGAIPGVASAIEIPEKPRPDEPPRGAVLTGQVALDSMQILCGDSKPGSLTPWQPGPADIARLEKLLPEFMAHQEAPRDYQPLHEYYRQYVGAVRDGKKKICVNFFHYIFVRETLERSEISGRAEDFWKRDLVFVFDGGAYFFQVQFDVETDTFLDLRFNGEA